MKYRQWIVRLGLCIALAIAPLALSACGGKDRDAAAADELPEGEQPADPGHVSEGTLMKGLRMAGVSVGDMKTEEAMAVLSPVVEQQVNAMTVTIVANGERFSYPARDLGVGVDIPTMLSSALALSADETIRAQAETTGYDLPLAYSVNPTILNTALGQLSSQIDRAVVEPTLSFTPDGAERFTVTPGEPGRALDVATLSTSIQQAVQSGMNPIEVQANVTLTQPTTTEDALRQNVQKIVTFSTPYTGSADRVTNLRMGAAKINGVMVKPGHDFSFNEVVGPRDESNGWKKAATIVGGSRFEDDYGGGICQVSTTLYNAVLKSDLKIVKRYRHSIPSNYIEHGLDATVSYGSLDFVFRNNTDYPIYIFSSVGDDSRFYVSIYGRPLPNGERIILRSKQMATIEPGDPEIIEDETLGSGQTAWEVDRRQGFTVQVYKEYMVGDQIVRTENMYQDTYQPVAGVKRMGAGGSAVQDNSADNTLNLRPEGEESSGSSGGDSNSGGGNEVVDFGDEDSFVDLPDLSDEGNGGGEDESFDLADDFE